MIFDGLQHQPPDPLLDLIKQFRDDGRPGKMDLGVGTYRDEQGRTPIMQAVKTAEQWLVERQQTKGYLGPEGDLRFVDLLRPIVFGAGDHHANRLVGVQAPGGSGALRLGAELVALARPGARIWLGTPTWSNHHPVLQAAGLHVVEYRYFDPETQSLRFDEMLCALSGAAAGDVVLLQGCCHNPTGTDLDQAQWDELASVLVRRRLLPLIDLAYQGLGQGLGADAAGPRTVLAAVPEALLAYSCDKNFGLYRDRTGALFVLGRDESSAAKAFGNLLTLARVNWAMPPDHGAAVVRCVLESDSLERNWRSELDKMARRISAVRRTLAALDAGLEFLTRQNGMFAQLALERSAVLALRRDHGIFVAGSGRINVAGLKVADAERFAHGLRAVGGLPARAQVVHV